MKRSQIHPIKGFRSLSFHFGVFLCSGQICDGWNCWQSPRRILWTINMCLAWWWRKFRKYSFPSSASHGQCQELSKKHWTHISKGRVVSTTASKGYSLGRSWSYGPHLVKSRVFGVMVLKYWTGKGVDHGPHLSKGIMARKTSSKCYNVEIMGLWCYSLVVFVGCF